MPSTVMNKLPINCLDMYDSISSSLFQLLNRTVLFHLVVFLSAHMQTLSLPHAYVFCTSRTETVCGTQCDRSNVSEHLVWQEKVKHLGLQINSPHQLYHGAQLCGNTGILQKQNKHLLAVIIISESALSSLRCLSCRFLTYDATVFLQIEL